MEERIFYEIAGFCFSIKDSRDPEKEKDAERTERSILDLGKIVNELANTDHQIVSFYPLTTYEGRVGFCDNRERGARIGYCFDFRDGKAYLAFSGDIDAEIARQTLIRDGYKIRKIKQIPGIVFSDVEYINDIGKVDKERDKKERLLLKIEERRAIEARHAENDIYCR